MTEPAHISDEQLSRYRDRTLTAVEVLGLDGHLSACSECRDRLYVDRRATSALKQLRSDLTEHLSHADIVFCSEGNGKPHALKHIRECSSCQAEVMDLSRFRTELVETPRRPMELPVKPWVRYRIPLGIAAAVLVVAGASTFALRRPVKTEQAQTTPPPTQVADPALPPAERQMIQQALATGRVERAAILDNLIRARGTLLSPSSPKPKIILLQPVGTTVLSDRPVLRWTPNSEATSYVVSIFDEKFQKLAESPAITATDWSPTGPLPIGKVLNWQVTARTASGSIHAPNPPEPEARFEVVGREVVARIEKLRGEFPGNPLLLALLYSQAGALDDAETALRSMEVNRSQPFLEHLRKIRNPE
jgi:hypothetical protein